MKKLKLKNQLELLKLANKNNITITQLKRLCNRYDIRLGRAGAGLFIEYLNQKQVGGLTLLATGKDIMTILNAIPLLELENLYIHNCYNFHASWNGENFISIDKEVYTLEEVIELFKDEPLLELEWEEHISFKMWLFLEGLSEKGNVIGQFYNITCDILFKELRAPMFHEKIEQLE